MTPFDCGNLDVDRLFGTTSSVRSSGGGFLAQLSEETRHLPATALDDRCEFGALCHRHANAVDRDIADLVPPVAVDQVPINLYWQRAGRANDLACHDGFLRAGPAAGHFERFAAISSQLVAVDQSDVIFEQLDEFLLLFLGGRLPIPPEHKTSDAGNVEILAEQVVKSGYPVRRGRVLAEHL